MAESALAAAAPAAGDRGPWVKFADFWKGKRARLKRGRQYDWRYNKSVRRYNKKLRNAKLTIGRQRELRFVVAYARRMLALTVGRGRVKHRELVAAAASAAWDAGYTSQQRRHGRRLMQLPRIQNAINEAFDKAAFSIEEAAAELAGIAKNVKVDPNARIRAIDLRFRLTTGLAVTPVVGKLQHEHNFNDKLFDSQQMHEALPVDADAPAIEGDVDADYVPAAPGNKKASGRGAMGEKRARQQRPKDAPRVA